MTFKGSNPYYSMTPGFRRQQCFLFLVSCSNESDPRNCFYRAKDLHLFESDQVKNIMKSFYNILKVIFTIKNCGICYHSYRFHSLKLFNMVGNENELTADHTLISILIFAYKS